ncbi:hypothetical protein R80B4_02458 [Fibrobacteres bacterium R8-0-B4]
MKSFFPRHSFTVSFQTSASRGLTMPLSVARMFLASPTTGTSTCTILETEAGSTSMCMTEALGANLATKPVTRSSKRTPTETIRSHSCKARLAHLAPCIPGIPMNSGCPPGKAPSPMNERVTGMFVVSASFLSSSCAPEATTPPPAKMIGFFALAISAAAFSICLGCPSNVGL